ncbi:MAG: hypothetical protein KAJ47_04145 [Candidatus Aenigmarchaeota archaeon]|nr:hypothetical protein [Candidatus Aenigmarchaeota archaeon]
MSSRKGFMRIIEVSLAAFIIISFLIVLSNFSPQTYETDRLQPMVYSFYDYLEQSGDLQNLTVSKNTTELYYTFGELIPAPYIFTVGWTNFTSSDYYSSPPIDKDVRSFSYVVAGKDETFAPTVFEIFIWE